MTMNEKNGQSGGECRAGVAMARVTRGAPRRLGRRRWSHAVSVAAHSYLAGGQTPPPPPRIRVIAAARLSRDPRGADLVFPGRRSFAPSSGLRRWPAEALAWQGTVGPNRTSRAHVSVSTSSVPKERCDVCSFTSRSKSARSGGPWRTGQGPSHVPPPNTDLAGPGTCDRVAARTGARAGGPAGGRCLAAARAQGGTASCSTLEVAGPGGVVALGQARGGAESGAWPLQRPRDLPIELRGQGGVRRLLLRGLGAPAGAGSACGGKERDCGVRRIGRLPADRQPRCRPGWLRLHGFVGEPVDLGSGSHLLDGQARQLRMGPSWTGALCSDR